MLQTFATVRQRLERHGAFRASFTSPANTALNEGERKMGRGHLFARMVALHVGEKRCSIPPSYGWSRSVASLSILWVVACGWALAIPAHAAGPAFVVAPTLTMDPNGVTPLAGAIEAETSVPTEATLSVIGPQGSSVVEFKTPETLHYTPVLGLLANTAYSFVVEYTDAAGDSIVSPPLAVVTPPLPSDFPQISVLVSQPEKMEPGYTLLDRFQGGSGARYTIITDSQGQVVWYSSEGAAGAQPTLQLPNGNLSWAGNAMVLEMDLLGNFAPAIPLAVNVHHDLFRTEHGTFLGLINDIISVENYPTSDTDPNAPTATAMIEHGLAIEFASDGSQLATWALKDLIDPTRIGYGSLTLRQPPPRFDWSHTNAIIHDPSDDSIIVSIRHQDAVIKFSRATGELKWILGPHANWKPEYQPFLLTPIGPLDWQYHQHSPTITPSGNLLLFDNGNFRASPFDGNPVVDGASRAVEFAIDENLMQVVQVWEYGMPPAVALYSGAISDADWMPETGNVLIDFGITTAVGGVPSSTLGLGNSHTRIIEVDHGAPAEVVFEMVVFDPASSLRTYRAERIPSLYPPSVDSVPALGAPHLVLLCLLIPAIGAAMLVGRDSRDAARA